MASPDVAWPVDKPQRHARLARKAWALGVDIALSPNRIGDDSDRYPPTYVYRDPISWLRAGCDGLVILDGEKARDELWYVDELRAEDEALGLELESLMKPPKWPGRVCIPISEQVV